MAPVGLSPELARFVHEAVASGIYPTEDALFAEGVRLLWQREQLRRDVQVGIDQLDRGEAIPAETVFADLRKKIAERTTS
ncbi:MAG TPA: CopG family transcriptional regulator [Pirellulales bacterium]|jgi:antitoxin ParD1/3/4|nr:CopG family transcriptional regulator [Pirellulales bacterium]